MESTLRQVLLEVFGPQAREAPLTALGGGITNQNFRLDIDGSSYVARIYGKSSELLGIDRAGEVACQEAAWELGLAPEVVRFLPQARVLLTRFVPGTTLSDAQAREPERMARIVAQLRRCHQEAGFPGRFCPFATVRTYLRRAEERGISLPRDWETARPLLGQLEQALGPGATQAACHNDLLAGNFIDDGAKLWILDWEYAARGDPFFDLGNFAVNQGLDAAGCERLLALYCAEVRGADVARLRRMRWVSDAREAAWAYLQLAISSLDFDYAAYGAKHLTRFLEGVGEAEL